MEEVNETISTIMDQVRWRELLMLGFQFVKVSPTELNLVKGHKTFSIKYEFGLDLYTVKEFTLNKDFSLSQETRTEVYCDDLQEQIKEFFKLKDYPGRLVFKL